MTVDNKPGDIVVDRQGKGTTMAAPELQQGTLDLLILTTLHAGALHGWAISRRIQQQSGDVLRVGQGSLYPALYRLEERGMIRASWGISDEGRRAKFYQLSAAGRRALAYETNAWRAYSGAVNLVLQGAGI
ncbi:MAG TPA: PadR family transcriptional regulator [Gemmatimonadaceae bacterium]